MPKSLHSGPNKKLRELLVEAREAADLTQASLSKKLSRPQSFVAKYENGERRLDVIEFLQISQAIGCDPLRILKQLKKAL